MAPAPSPTSEAGARVDRRCAMGLSRCRRPRRRLHAGRTQRDVLVRRARPCARGAWDRWRRSVWSPDRFRDLGAWRRRGDRAAVRVERACLGFRGSRCRVDRRPRSPRRRPRLDQPESCRRHHRLAASHARAAGPDRRRRTRGPRDADRAVDRRIEYHRGRRAFERADAGARLGDD